jgi:hypothetical protein
MKIAYLILAHANPNHLKKLINILSCDDCSFYLHIDKKSDIDEFLSIWGDNIFFITNRISVYWAEYSMVEAILMLIQQAIISSKKYEYCVLLSGSDYPLRSKEYIHNFFSKYRGIEFISMVKVPNEEARVPLSKINTLAIPSKRKIYKFFLKICVRLGLAKRDYKKYLGNLEPYGGSTWWALTRGACEYVLDFVNKNQQICKYFERTYTSDETFFHTILGNSMFKLRVRRSLTYDDWSVGSLHPAMISDEHLNFFGAQEKVSLNDAFGPGELLFARKFSDDSLEFVRRIDEMIRRKDLMFGVTKSCEKV